MRALRALISKSIHLYCDEKLSSWLLKRPLKQQFIIHKRQRIWLQSTLLNSPLSLDTLSAEGLVLDGGFRVVALLMKALPHVAKEGCFALKGGAAINLFIRNLPRFSVDIDLTCFAHSNFRRYILGDKCPILI